MLVWHRSVSSGRYYLGFSEILVQEGGNGFQVVTVGRIIDFGWLRARSAQYTLENRLWVSVLLISYHLNDSRLRHELDSRNP